MDKLINLEGHEFYRQPFVRSEAVVPWTPGVSTADAMTAIVSRFDKGASVSAFISKMREIKRLTRAVRHGSHRTKVAARRELRARYAMLDLLTK